MNTNIRTGDKKVLSYGDILLRKSDVDLLGGPFWLNDQIITFYFDYMCKEVFPSHQPSLLFVGGTMTFLLSQLAGAGDISDLVAPLQLSSRSLVFFAVNDNQDANSAEGGSHWTLAVYAEKDKTFSHYDSASGSRNLHIAKQIAGSLQPYLGEPSNSIKVEAVSSPLQTNAYDCGVYVLACAEVIAQQWTRGCTPQKTEEALRRLTPSAVKDVRAKILDLIQTKVAQANS